MSKYIIDWLIFVLLLSLLNSCTDIPKSTEAGELVFASSTTDSIYPKIQVNPTVKLDSTNRIIIDKLYSFLSIKNQDPRSEEFWRSEDFDKYMLPYQDILYIEASKESEFTFRPLVLEIIQTKDSSNYLIKIAFVSYDQEAFKLRAIYDLLIDITDFKFRRVLDYKTKDWETFKIGHTKFIVSNRREFNRADAFKHEKNNQNLASFFSTPIKTITYYSCVSPREVFEIKGFDYIHNMYMAEYCGLNEYTSHIIFSGRDQDIYLHELIHSYLYDQYFSNYGELVFLHEGMATYYGGSGKLSYKELRDKLKRYVKDNPDIDLKNYLNPYTNDDSINELAYTIGGLFCEYALKTMTKEEFLQLFEEKSLHDVFAKVGLTENFNYLLMSTLEEPYHEFDFKKS